VAIARALVTRPEVLLLDEPFSALDAFTRVDLQDHLLDLWADTKPTLLLVTHDVEEAIVLADRIVVMRPHPGRLQEDIVTKLPLTMGHEIVGEVVALGPDAKGVKVGDRRLVYPWIGCGTCKVCQSGEEQLCLAPKFLGVFANGGYSDHVLVPHARYLLDYGD